MDSAKRPRAGSPPANVDEGQPATFMKQHANAEGSGNHIHLPNEEEDHVTGMPPYWSRPSQHGRTVSSISYQSIGHQRPAPILLEDHSEEDNVMSQSCWAKSATIDEGVLVSGPTGIGAYVVWHCTVKTLKGGDIALRKRYVSYPRSRDSSI